MIKKLLCQVGPFLEQWKNPGCLHTNCLFCAEGILCKKRFVWAVRGYDVFIEHWVSIMPSYHTHTHPSLYLRSRFYSTRCFEKVCTQGKSKVMFCFVIEQLVNDWRLASGWWWIESYTNIISQLGGSWNWAWLRIPSEPLEIKRLNRSPFDCRQNTKNHFCTH